MRELDGQDLGQAWMIREATRIDGEIDLARAGEVRDLVTSSLQTERLLVLDLTGVTFMDVAGFRAIWEPTRQIDADRVRRGRPRL